MTYEQFFNRLPFYVAQDLLGSVIRVPYDDQGYLCAQIIETEAYSIHERGSHAWLGYTPKRGALFMQPGTVYMYYARGGDSLNISCLGPGNAVLIKSGIPYLDQYKHPRMVDIMQTLNPLPKQRTRPFYKLCSGQTLLCYSLNLKVPDWDQTHLDSNAISIDDVDNNPSTIIQTKRLGIADNRDGHWLYRFIDERHANYCSSNPLKKQSWYLGQDYFRVSAGSFFCKK